MLSLFNKTVSCSVVAGLCLKPSHLSRDCQSNDQREGDTALMSNTRPNEHFCLPPKARSIVGCVKKENWVECMMSSAISFAYLAEMLNLNISGTNADICKRQTAFLFLHGVLCDTPEKSGCKNLITVPL